MGREIRRVPKGWEHPKDRNGRYRPLHNESYETVAAEYLAALLRWEAGQDPDRKKSGYRYFWEWAGTPPDKAYCRPAWTTEATCFQIYETVSEGTPVSPVFETKVALIDWLVRQGHSTESATRFAKAEWAPSMVMTADR